jgi:hypothetical protein
LRKCEPFLNALEYLASANLSELKLMIASARESPLITRRTSLKMILHILKFVGKKEMHLKFKTFWLLVKHDFDSCFSDHVGLNVPSPSIRRMFVHGLRFALGALLPYQSILNVEQALTDKRNLPIDIFVSSWLPR